ncbi:unnamed protein product [Cuscuta campestris]|uniref:Reverse transcriptase domain-containing protein n=1 Tax=Cuscuta campestris TaxID=132261 RepID=A0A484NFJ4_9ASTE|nr:unnamed protein product [Cuscuta campestris]
MYVTKWSPNLRQDEDSPNVPVWISFPHLPIHLHEQRALFNIASMLGTPLKVDQATLNFTRPKCARVCVEVDVSKPLHQRIHIKHVDEDLFFQVQYEDPPVFCNFCRKLGHNLHSCKLAKPMVREPLKDQEIHKVHDKNPAAVLDGWTTVQQVHEAVPVANSESTAIQPIPLEDTSEADIPLEDTSEEDIPLKMTSSSAPPFPKAKSHTSKITHFNMTTKGGNFSFVISGVYGAHTTGSRKALWDNIKSFNESNSSPWLLGGDFNAISDILHHKGKKLPDLEGVEDFQNCISDCNLLESSFTGPCFTWHGVRSNGKIWKRLDRVFFNEKWAQSWSTITMQHVSKGGSDHSPIITTSKNEVAQTPRSFRFQNMWLLDGNFKNLCKIWWEEIPYYGGMKCLFHKLNHLKTKISTWNKESFGNIFDLVQEAEKEASKAEMDYENDPSEHNREIANLKQAQLIQIGNKEHCFWKQKCNLKWFKDGDANTSFFHSLVKDRRRHQRIHFLKDDDGQTQNDPLVLESMVISYYHNLFNNAEPTPAEDTYEDFLSSIPTIIDQNQNQFLIRLPTEEEVKNNLWEMDSNSCAGPDGYNVHFFKECWDFIKREVTSACQEVFLGIPMPSAASSSNICLIPKCENASKLSDFRPICLSTVASKIATKCIANRLRQLLPLIISEEQGAFVPGREISNRILITKEMAHNMDRKAEGANIIIKLDLTKAFDKVKWSYLLDILQRFGFCRSFLHMVKTVLKTSKYSVLFNGKPCGFFWQSRGIKQGDPLSPLLFIIANEGFSRNINKLFMNGVLGRFNCGRKSIPISHLSYADDIIIFTNAHLKRFILNYQQVSGQTINSSKCSFFTGKKFNSLGIRKLEKLLDMPHRKFPFTYLGSPIHTGITRKSHCTNIISAFDRKLNGWHQHHLDQDGRLILINHVLNTIPNYFLATHTMPKSIVNILHQKMARFWWGGNSKKHHWLSWDTLSLPKEEGGIGTRNFQALEEAFSMKLWWKFTHNDSLWCRFMRAKYMRNGDMDYHLVDSPT